MNKERCDNCIHLMMWEENGEMHQDCGYGITSAKGISRKLKYGHWNFIAQCETTRWAFPNCAPICAMYAWKKDILEFENDTQEDTHAYIADMGEINA